MGAPSRWTINLRPGDLGGEREAGTTEREKRCRRVKDGVEIGVRDEKKTKTKNTVETGGARGG